MHRFLAIRRARRPPPPAPRECSGSGPGSVPPWATRYGSNLEFLHRCRQGDAGGRRAHPGAGRYPPAGEPDRQGPVYSRDQPSRWRVIAVAGVPGARRCHP